MTVVTFRLVDNGATVVDAHNGDSTYRATFEIDFWADYAWGYTVESRAVDLAGNEMATQTGGGLEYVVAGIVAGILAFLAGAEMAGGVLGFFMGFAAGLFEDLTNFLHLQEMWNAIQQLPKILGQVLGDPSILLALIQDMVVGWLSLVDDNEASRTDGHFDLRQSNETPHVVSGSIRIRRNPSRHLLSGSRIPFRTNVLLDLFPSASVILVVPEV